MSKTVVRKETNRWKMLFVVSNVLYLKQDRFRKLGSVNFMKNQA